MPDNLKGSSPSIEAIEASVKAAWFTQLLIKKNFSEFILYQNTIGLDKLLIENLDYNFLNRLNTTNKAAFYYWYKCLELKNLVEYTQYIV